MQQIHLPTLGARYWAALCLASIFGANMGTFSPAIWDWGTSRDFRTSRSRLPS